MTLTKEETTNIELVGDFLLRCTVVTFAVLIVPVLVQWLARGRRAGKGQPGPVS